MPEHETSSRGLLKRAVGTLAGAAAPEVHPGTATAVDGATAAARIDEAAGAVVATGSTGCARLASALGLAAAGERVTACLAGPELAEAADLLREAARRRLALVVRWRSGEGGHAPLSRALGSGAVVLAAADAQEAADLSLIARRVAEEGLVPVLLAQDGAETSASVQDVLLPEAAWVARWLGAAGDRVHSPTRAQELLFGRHRRRLVRWHDPERPMVQGAVLAADVEAVAAAGGRAYLDEALPALLERAFTDLARETGRHYDRLSTRGVEGAQLVLVAQGSAVGTAEAVAEVLGSGAPRLGIAGLHCLAPFPSAHLAEVLRGVPAVAVIERTAAPLSAGGTLARAVRSALAWCQDAADVRTASGPAGRRSLAAEVRAALSGTEGGGPPRRIRHTPGPAVASVLVPGELAGADLAALCRELLGSWRSTVHLGVAFEADPRGRLPKREVLHDALAGAYPAAGALGLRAGRPGPDLRPAGSLSMAVYAGGAGSRFGGGLAAEAAGLLAGTLGGRVRSGGGRVLWAPPGPRRLADPGPDAPVDVAVWAGPGTAGPELVACLAAGASLLIPTPHPGRDGARPLHPEPPPHPTQSPLGRPGPRPNPADLGPGGRVAAPDRSDWWTALPAAVRDAVTARGAKLYTVDLTSPGSDDERLGALLGLLQKDGRADFKVRKVLEARRALLAVRGLGPAEVDERLARLQAGLDRVRALPAAELAVRRTPEPEADPVPPAVRQSSTAGGETVDSLPRFWDQVGVLARRGEGDLLSPDPYLATRTLPALSGALRDASDARTALPAFDPVTCTGCGACWTSCPHAAVEPVAIGAAALLDYGMAVAKRRGTGTDALRAAVGKLAAATQAEAAAAGGGSAGALLDAAYAASAAKLPLPEERKAAVAEAFTAVREELAHLPVAHAAAFPDQLFLLALDPDRCTGCGLCVAACGPGALTSVADTPSRTHEARRVARAIQELPEPSAGALDRISPEAFAPEAGALALSLLPRSSRRLAAGGDASEPGSGEALAVRQALGAAARRLEPLRRRRAESLDALAEELAAAVHGGLGAALPDRDLDALAQGLAVLDRPAADLAELTGRIDAALTEGRESGRVDVARMRRLVDAARDVADLRLHLRGAAPFGLVLSGGPAAWGATFPNNAFAVPATVAPPRAAAAVARGLAEAACREAVAAARRVRAARLVLAAATPSEATRAEGEVRALAGLGWSGLDAGERLAAIPVVLAASEEALASDLTGLLELLSCDLPVKVLALAADGAPTPLAELLVAWVSASSLPGAVLGQVTVAHGDRLDAALAAALAAPVGAAVSPAFAPALLRVLAPVPSRGGFAPDGALARAREAVADRSFPLFLRAPREDGSIGLDLDGNPPEDGAVEDPAAWTTLRRAAGSDGAFAAAAVTDQARRERDEAERRHREETDALRAEYEARIHEIETGARVALAREVRARLLALATGGPDRPPAPNGGAEPAAPEAPEGLPGEH
jgi:pyruvate-ferredoxin/flavodoxin oxidoreductase